MLRLHRTVLAGAAVLVGAAASLFVASPALAVTGRVLVSADSLRNLVH